MATLDEFEVAIKDNESLLATISSWLTLESDEVDIRFAAKQPVILNAVEDMNERANQGDTQAFHCQQLLLYRIYQTSLTISDSPTAEASSVLYAVTRSIERATAAAEDANIAVELLDAAPEDPSKYLSWLKAQVKSHRGYKHPYYTDFINHSANEADIRRYVIQESLVDGRFDDFLALMQVGTSGASKMEIAGNYWDEMGNGDPEGVHTYLFNKIYEVFEVKPEELEGQVTAADLLSGNLTVMLCRYRHLYPEAVGYLGMTEWLAPDRFSNVISAWERLGLPEVGITYHRLHLTIDSKHAAGWFHNVVKPAATSEYMRRGIARGALWRINSSARLLDERLAKTLQPA